MRLNSAPGLLDKLCCLTLSGVAAYFLLWPFQLSRFIPEPIPSFAGLHFTHSGRLETKAWPVAARESRSSLGTMEAYLRPLNLSLATAQRRTQDTASWRRLATTSTSTTSSWRRNIRPDPAKRDHNSPGEPLPSTLQQLKNP